MEDLRDRLARPLQSLRVSVTDRCNLRCQYCMPEAEYVWLPKQDVLTFEETRRLVGVFTGLGVDKVRLTGGEPLLRKDLPELVRMLAELDRVREIALTTNGLLLAAQARELKDAGLSRITVSLDTLDRARFQSLTRRDQIDDVLRGIDAAKNAGFEGLKLDTVVIRGTNEDEVGELLDFARGHDAEVRFIEYMDVGGATKWSDSQVFTQAEILETVESRFGGPIEPIDLESWAPAKRYRLPDGTTFGIIATMTAPFCRTCDRSRLTADGLWYLCLYASKGIDLRAELRRGATDEELTEILTSSWRARDDRGAELRQELAERTPVEIEGLRKDPHLEMHTRGG